MNVETYSFCTLISRNTQRDLSSVLVWVELRLVRRQVPKSVTRPAREATDGRSRHFRVADLPQAPRWSRSLPRSGGPSRSRSLAAGNAGIAPGYRIGWLAAGRHRQAVLLQKLASTLATPALTQAALTDLLSCGGYDSHLRRIRRVFAGNIDRMTRAIERCFPAGTRVSRPAGGFVFWIELPGPVDTRVLFGEAVKLGICFAPGDVFSASDRCGLRGRSGRRPLRPAPRRTTAAPPRRSERCPAAEAMAAGRSLSRYASSQTIASQGGRARKPSGR
jgi:hypothetical protein